MSNVTVDNMHANSDIARAMLHALLTEMKNYLKYYATTKSGYLI